MTSKRETSYLWTYFTQVDKVQKIANCDLCKNNFSYKTTATNLKKHLVTKHPNEFVPFTYTIICPEEGGTTTVVANDTMESTVEDQEQDDQEQEYVVLEPQKKKSKMRSNIWNYFAIINHEERVAACEICQKVCSFKTTTSNLKRHIAIKHPEVGIHNLVNNLNDKRHESIQEAKFIPSSTSTVRKLVQARPPMRSITIPKRHSVEVKHVMATSDDVDPFANLNDHSESEKPIKTEIKVFEPKRQILDHKKLAEEKSKNIDSQLLKFLYKGFYSYSMVDNKDFADLIKMLNPMYKKPSKKIIANVMIPAKYEKAQKAAKELLEEAESVCLTTEIWVSQQNDSYISLSAHFVHNFKLKSVLLSCECLPTQYNSSHIAGTIEHIVGQYNLQNKILVCITDNSSDIVAAVKDLLMFKHLPCFAKTINLIVNDCLVTQTEFLNKIKSIVNFFNLNATNSELLRTTQINLGNAEPKTITKSVDNRWISTFKMLKRFSELEVAVTCAMSVLDTEDLENLSTEEWEHCKELFKILEPFEEVSRQICQEKYARGSDIIILIQGMHHVLEELKKELTNPVTKQIAEDLQTSLDNGIKNIEYNLTLGMATLFDPRYKVIPFTDESLQKLKETAIACIENIISTQDPVAEPEAEPEKNEKSSFSVWGAIDKMVTKASPKCSAHTQATLEFERYLEAPYVSRHEDPLLWWEQNQHAFPNVSKVMKQNYNVLASSVPCEWIFTKEGLDLMHRRSVVSPKIVQQLVFLNQNSELFLD